MINNKIDEYIKRIDSVIEEGKYKDNWASLAKHPVPEWFKNAKFGIFIHWGVYSVPAFGNEWYPRNMYIKDSDEYKHHIETYGRHKDFGYKDFIPMFKAEKFDANNLAELFKQSGAKYVVPVAEHHDGFQMYGSELSKWNAAQMGPERNVLQELFEAFDKKNLINGASSHRAEHWFFMGHGKEFDSDMDKKPARDDLYWPSEKECDPNDIYSKPEPTKEYLDDWLVRTCEIIDVYRPKLLYFDWWIQHDSFKPYIKKLAAYYYNRADEWNEAVLINYKNDAYFPGTAVVDVERGQFAETKPFYWQSDTAVALNSWGYTKNNRYKKVSDILCDLIDIVSKNGNMLLNVGPKPDGTIPKEDADILLEIGEWFKINGEAIYDTMPWKIYGEGGTKVKEGGFSDGEVKQFGSDDIRYTMKDGCLYAFVLKGSDNGEYEFKSLGLARYLTRINDVRLLGSDELLKWDVNRDRLKITGVKYTSDKPLCFIIE